MLIYEREDADVLRWTTNTHVFILILPGHGYKRFETSNGDAPLIEEYASDQEFQENIIHRVPDDRLMLSRLFVEWMNLDIVKLAESF